MSQKFTEEIKMAKKNQEKKPSLTATDKMQGNISPNGILHHSENKQVEL